MKRNMFDHGISRLVAAGVAIILVLIPFHAFLTVWLSSGIGHYTALRLWKEVVLLAAGLGAMYLVVRSKALQRRLAQDWLWRLTGIYIVATIICGLAAYLLDGVTAKAVLYGELVNIRPFAMLFVAWVAAQSVTWLYRRWKELVLVPASGVVAIGLLQQFVLPHDVLKHFGYNDSTISPYQTIDHKVEYIRVRSTLRGSNLLGAYLIPILSALVVLLSRQRLVLACGAVLATVVVLFGSGSRGAWLGAIVALAVLVWLRISDNRLRRILIIFSSFGLVVVSLTVFLLRDVDLVQNLIFHTDEHSTSAVSTNSAHLTHSFDALKQVAVEPLGRGVGTAGPASIYNTEHGGRIAENYFLQIGQEAGWLGLGLFIAVYVLLARRLWQNKSLALAQILLASLAGLTAVAMLMHIWTDDTIAYLWFGLAGVLLGHTAKGKHEKAR